MFTIAARSKQLIKWECAFRGPIQGHIIIGIMIFYRNNIVDKEILCVYEQWICFASICWTTNYFWHFVVTFCKWINHLLIFFVFNAQYLWLLLTVDLQIFTRKKSVYYHNMSALDFCKHLIACEYLPYEIIYINEIYNCTGPFVYNNKSV